MASSGGRRVHLPILTAATPLAEPAIAEGGRSLRAWSTLRADLADEGLRASFAADPTSVLARYGIRGTPEQVAAFASALRRDP